MACRDPSAGTPAPRRLWERPALRRIDAQRATNSLEGMRLDAQFSQGS